MENKYATKEFMDELNLKFKELETYEQVRDFEEELEKFGFCFEGKRNGLWATDFCEDIIPERICYHSADGRSLGNPLIKNLYKVLRIARNY